MAIRFGVKSAHKVTVISKQIEFTTSGPDDKKYIEVSIKDYPNYKNISVADIYVGGFAGSSDIAYSSNKDIFETGKDSYDPNSGKLVIRAHWYAGTIGLPCRMTVPIIIVE